MHKDRHQGTLLLERGKQNHRQQFCFQQAYIKHHLSEPRCIMKCEDTGGKFYDWRRQMHLSDYVRLRLFWLDHLGVNCSSKQKRRHVVSIAGSPVPPLHLLCMFLPAHPAAQSTYLCRLELWEGLPLSGHRVDHGGPSSASLSPVPLDPRWEKHGMVLHVSENCVHAPGSCIFPQQAQ